MGNTCKKQPQTQRQPARLAQTHLLHLFPARWDKSWAILGINAKLQVPKDAHPCPEDAAVPQAGSVLQGEVGAGVQDSSGSQLNPSHQLSTRGTLHRAPTQPPKPGLGEENSPAAPPGPGCIKNHLWYPVPQQDPPAPSPAASPKSERFIQTSETASRLFPNAPVCSNAP